MSLSPIFSPGSARRWTAGAVALLFLGLLPRCCPAAPALGETPLLELPQNESSARETVTLKKVADKYHREHQADWLIVYLWNASGEWHPPVQPVFVEELQNLDEQCWDQRLASKMTPISIVTVFAGSEAERGEVYRAIQKAARGEQRPTALERKSQRIPTFVDVTGQFATAAAEKLEEKMLFVPALFRVKVDSLAITECRGDDPVRAGTWVALLGKATEHVEGDPEDLPAGCENSWFRRQITRVVRAGLVEVGPDRPFGPKSPVTDAELLSWLAKISPERAAGVLRDMDAKRPGVLSRERAFTAMVRFLWGEETSAELAKCPLPSGEVTEGWEVDPAAIWRDALSRIPGAVYVNDTLRPYLTLALAKGLLCHEPSLHARWPLTRESAAWLLDHALGATLKGPTGVLVDCTDLPLESDRRFGRGEIYVEETGGKPRRLYPADALSRRLPIPPNSYPVVLYLEQGPGTDADQHRAGWLTQRVGERPLVIRPLRVLGQGTLGRSVVISAENAARLLALNQETGALDHWRVAFLSGVGAQLAESSGAPLPRRSGLTVQFSAAMDPSTIRPDTIWLQRADTGERVAADLSPRPGSPFKVHLQPAAPLAPGLSYDLMLGAALRSARGEPLVAREQDQLPPGVARRWTFTTENVVSAYLFLSGLPEGAEVYVRDELQARAPLDSALEVVTAPGPLPIRIRSPDGTSRAITCQVDKDGTYAVRLEPPKPARLLLEGLPTELTLGQKATVKLQALDAEGNAVREHVPITVRLNPTGCEILPDRSLTFSGGEVTFTFWSDRPGKATIVIEVSEPDVVVQPALVELYCRYLPTEAPPVWSPVEGHRLPRPSEREADIVISPRLRRWFGRETTREIRVVTENGMALQRVAQLPGRDEFSVDAHGMLHFHRTAAGSMVEISYQYRRGRCGVLVIGLPGAEPATAAVERALRDFLEDIGYLCAPREELIATLGSVQALTSSQWQAQARKALEVLALDELFVAQLSSPGDQAFSLSLLLYSLGERGPRPAAYPETEAPVLFRIDRGRAVPFDPDHLRQELERVLDPWLEEVGLRPSNSKRIRGA